MTETDRRRRYDTRRFTAELETLDSDQIRERLNSNRIRSRERRAIAEEILRRRSKGAPPDEDVVKAEDVAQPEAAVEIEASGRVEDADAGAAEAVGATAGTGAEDTLDKLRQGVADAVSRARREDVPSARRLGRVLGTVLVVGGAVALVAGLLRR
jgi:hypothetical protein